MNDDEFGEELYKEYLYFEYEEKYKKAQQKIDKAIEYIESFINYLPKEDKAIELLTILKGSDKK